jgi:glyoxylase-like metal-dependent hydrolase (beta-lactamase superfamily II)
MRIWSTSTGKKIYQVLSGRSNVFLLTNNNQKILIDTSPDYMWRTLQNRLDRLQINHIDLLILTHSHFDHAANAARIKEKYKAKVIIQQTETKYLTTGDNILPVGTNAASELLVKAFAKHFNSFTRYSPCMYDLTFDKSFDLKAYGFNGSIIHTPGHTIGSSSIIIDNEIALVGDTMVGVFWWTVFPPFASDKDILIESWGKLLETQCKIFLPSHGSVNKRSLLQVDYFKRISA